VNCASAAEWIQLVVKLTLDSKSMIVDSKY